MNLKIFNILFSAESKSFEWVLSKKIDYAVLLESKIIIGGKDVHLVDSKLDTVVLPRQFEPVHEEALMAKVTKYAQQFLYRRHPNRQDRQLIN